MDELTHLDDKGHATMVDVSSKADSARVAVASGRVILKPTTLALIGEGRCRREMSLPLPESPVLWPQSEPRTYSALPSSPNNQRQRRAQDREFRRRNHLNRLRHRQNGGGNGSAYGRQRCRSYDIRYGESRRPLRRNHRYPARIQIRRQKRRIYQGTG